MMDKFHDLMNAYGKMVHVYMGMGYDLIMINDVDVSVMQCYVKYIILYITGNISIYYKYHILYIYIYIYMMLNGSPIYWLII